MNDNNEGEGIFLDAHSQEEVMQALLIGLHSYGEIERLTNSFELLKMTGRVNEDNKDLRPIHPTGSPDTVNLFASALRMVHACRCD